MTTATQTATETLKNAKTTFDLRLAKRQLREAGCHEAVRYLEEANPFGSMSVRSVRFVADRALTLVPAV